jgi:23S rRNA pseudouridine1911/1915/1917 synthase
MKNYSLIQTSPLPPPAAAPSAMHTRVPADCAGLRFDQALARLFPEYSRSRLTTWIKAGHATIEGAARGPSDKVWEGEHIAVQPAADPRETAFRAQDIPIDVVFEDAHLIVINKPAGLVVHPGSGNWDGTLLNALLQHAPALAHVPRAGIVHRLDKDTSGLLVVAKTLTAQTALVRQVQDHSVAREYLALAHGLVKRAGSVDAPIGRHKIRRTRMAVGSGGKPAVTHYEPIEHFAQTTLLRCRLETGRTHQIRVHLASIGHPIVGDAVYGGNRTLPAFHRQALHAEKLAFNHPATGRRRAWHARAPADMRKLITALKRAT